MAQSSAFDHKENMIAYDIPSSADSLTLKGTCLTSSSSSEWKGTWVKGLLVGSEYVGRGR